jgi:glycyl-tRNA synthetase beta chain
MSTKPLLIELFTEELPPKALKKLGEAFGNSVFTGLQRLDLLGGNAKLEWFATPRRIAARVSEVLEVGAPKERKTKLMSKSAGFDANGKPTVALVKKLEREYSRSPMPENMLQDILRDRVSVENDGKNDNLVHTVMASGQHLATSIDSLIDDTLRSLPIPKVMNYQLADGVTDVSFVRPAHRLLVIHGSNLVEARALGLSATDKTKGHRFQGGTGDAMLDEIEIGDAVHYEKALREFGKVEPVYATRREMILTQLEAKAKALGASLGAAETYADLLDEVTSLVEWPTVYTCQFEAEYLAVPQECLILTMKTNQKYFPLFDANGKLKNQFLIVSNMELDDPSRVITGNERVVRPRLADARFFFETDKKTKLEARVPELAKVVYHNKLGTTGERIERLSKLAGEIAALIGADVEKAKRAATLAKADLVTLMVGEFPELQGTMGRYYALNDGEPADVAAACAEHYQPRFAGDALPSPGVPTAVALADKLETLAGLFSIGQEATGDKDPFALRRHALGVIRILIEHKLPVDLNQLLDAARSLFAPLFNEGVDSSPGWQAGVLDVFVEERLRSYCKELGYDASEVMSVLDKSPKRLDRVPGLLSAVREFSRLPEAASLCAANKRVANIIKKAVLANENIETNNATQEPAEAALRNALNAVAPKADALFKSGDFTGYLKSFAALKAPVDDFFDKVMVMAEDKAVRANRLALLRDLREAMNKVADLSKLAG